MASPSLAVVIPTRNREERLSAALEALSRQTLPADRFEVVVVRDRDQEGPYAQAPSGLSVRFLWYEGSSGPTAKRNLGWRSTSASQIAFTDDDCRPAPDWLEILAGEFAENAFIQGRTEADPLDSKMLNGFARSRVVTEPDPWYPFCNTAFPRALLEDLGGLDESYRFGGEDTDLALRALERGARFEFHDSALVWHAVLERTFAMALRESTAWTSYSLLLSRHPQQRRHLTLRLFRNWSHATLVLGAIGALSFSNPSARAVSMTPYAVHKLHPHFRDGMSAGKAARVALRMPAWIALDLAEVVSTARSAIRHRVPVL